MNSMTELKTKFNEVIGVLRKSCPIQFSSTYNRRRGYVSKQDMKNRLDRMRAAAKTALAVPYKTFYHRTFNF